MAGKANTGKPSAMVGKANAGKPNVKNEPVVKSEPKVKKEPLDRAKEESAASSSMAPQARVLQEVVSMLRHGMQDEEVWLSK